MTSEQITAVIAEFHRDFVVPEMDERERRLKAELRVELKADFRYEIHQLRADLPAMLIEFVTPEIQRVEERLGARIDDLRDETMSNFDSVYKRFDNLEIECQSLTVAVGRLEVGHRDLSAAVRRLEERSRSA